MKNLFKTTFTFVAGIVAGFVIIENSTNKGEVVYEDDDIYVRADKTVSGGSSHAKVFYKNPK